MAKKPFPFKVCEQCCDGTSSGGGGDDRLFVADIMTATVEEITTAVRAKKVVIARYSNKIYPLMGGNSTEWVFGYVDEAGELVTKVCNAEGWFDNSRITFTTQEYVDEQLDNKADKETTEWQLIESGTLTEDVLSVTCDLKGGHYKKLFLHFVLQPMNPDKASDFPKGRSSVFCQGDTHIYDDGSGYYVGNEREFNLTYEVTMIGKDCIVERKHMAVPTNGIPYITNTSNERQGQTIGRVLSDDFISALKVNMYPTDTWRFPAGTTYELWGVKA